MSDLALGLLLGAGGLALLEAAAIWLTLYLIWPEQPHEQ